jgi:hypothetical protein
MTDRYTKAALTVIAAALIALVAEQYVKPLNAQGGVQKVQLCDDNYPQRCAFINRNALSVVTWRERNE